MRDSLTISCTPCHLDTSHRSMTAVQNICSYNPCGLLTFVSVTVLFPSIVCKSCKSCGRSDRGLDPELTSADIPPTLLLHLDTHNKLCEGVTCSSIMGRMVKDLTTLLKTALATRRNSFHGLETPGNSLAHYHFIGVVVPGSIWSIQLSGLASCAAIGRVRKGQTKIADRLPSSTFGLGDFLGTTLSGGGQSVAT